MLLGVVRWVVGVGPTLGGRKRVFAGRCPRRRREASGGGGGLQAALAVGVQYDPLH